MLLHLARACLSCTTRWGLCVVLLLGVSVWTSRPAQADTARPRAEVAGYFRVMTRPDVQGGDGKLGYWNLYGRLLNEGPWASLELRVDLLQDTDARKRDPWVSVHYKLEGGSVMTADAQGGSLAAFRMSQLYVQAGNLLLKNVTWQLGTLDTWMGDLALYDLKPAQLFYDTLGLSGTLRLKRLDLTVGLGDAGFLLRGLQYAPVLTGGVLARLRPMDHLELGLGAQGYFEPQVASNRFSPHTTPGMDYADLVRGEVLLHYLQDKPGSEDLFYKDRPPQASAATSYKAVAYLGFGGFGPLTWNNLFAHLLRKHPDVLRSEHSALAGRDYDLYVSALTDERFELQVGDEAQISLWPQHLELVWAALYGEEWNGDNRVAAGEDNRRYYSSVLRLQLYLTRTLHLLLESSLARETSTRGNLWRLAHDSIFQSQDGVANNRGLEFGDTDTRDTWQLKFGPVLNPSGYGIFARPSLRLLVGLQRSNTQQAFGSSVSGSLDEYQVLGQATRSIYQHVVIALEAEAWF